jgi:drug/metabolite transporter (DMT)-like permease
MSTRTKGIVIALIATSVWATTGLFIDYLLDNYNIQKLTLAFWRDFLIAVGLLALLSFTQRQALKIRRRDIPFFVAYGFFGLAIFNSLWTYSVGFNGPAVATVLAFSSPAFTVLLARPFLKEPLTGRKMMAVALSLAGCALVAEAYSPEVWQVNTLGILVGLATGLAFAFYNLAGRWSSGRFPSSWTVTLYGFAFASLGLSLTQRPDTLFTMGTQWSGWVILIILSLGPSLIGYSLYTLSLHYLQAGTAGLIATLEPAFTAIMAIFIVPDKQLGGIQWLGTGLILLAVILAQLDASNVKRQTAPMPAD